MVPRTSASAAVLSMAAIMCIAAGPSSRPTMQPMTDERLDALITNIDAKATIKSNVRQLTVEGRKVLVVSDANADRMRIMTPVARADELEPDILQRLLQANFDAVLDARYAIGQKTLWSTYIHPLSPLTPEQFYSGLAQVVVAAETFGTTYSSGVLVFSGGDTEALNRALYERILKKGKINI